MRDHDQLYIDGAWVVPDGSGTIAVINATTEEPMGHIPEGSASDADRAVQAANAAFGGWAATTPTERAAHVAKIAEGLDARKDEIAETITGEVGMPIFLSKIIQAGLPAASAAAGPRPSTASSACAGSACARWPTAGSSPA